MRIVFLGTPGFAVPSLTAVARLHAVAGVVTQPDRPAGRGRRLSLSAVKQAAESLGLPILQPENASSPEAVAEIAGLQPDLIVVAAFGQLLRPRLLRLPRLGCINVHASLLPRWRGASPIQAALIHGDGVTGVTIMQMDAGLDTGPILSRRELAIRADHTGGSLTAELAEIGADLLVLTLAAYLAGDIVPTPQDDTLATTAPRLAPSDTYLDPAKPAVDLARRVRAFAPQPGARILWNAEALRVLEAHASAGREVPTGKVVVHGGLPAMATRDGLLVFDRLQMSGGRPVDGRSFLAGHPALSGAVLTRLE